MTDFHRILTPGCVQTNVAAASKKRALEQASELIAAEHIDISARQLFDQLMARERLGSTALGEGVAIPHCRSQLASDIVGAMLKLEQPIDFEAPDGQGVDLVFALVVPQDGADTHLQVLAQLAALFSAPENRAQLRTADSAQRLFDKFLELMQTERNARAS